MSDDVLVSVEGVSKKFCRDLKRSLWYGVKDLTSELLRRDRQHELRRDEFWAASDVSFEVKRGEVLGLIGENGAGKTTLLRAINGLIKPDRGRITVKGRVGALIQLGTGFHPLLTGRENIYINGTVLGMPKSEIDRRYDEIVEFSGVADFIDAPVRSYSSGMRVRLGFSVAAHLSPDLLLIDEVLAVGDLAFQRKGLNRIAQFVKEGGATILVSHSLDKIRSICTSCLYLSKGKARFHGDLQSAIKLYVDDMISQSLGVNGVQGRENSYPSDTPIVLRSVEFSSPSLSTSNTVKSGETVNVTFLYDALQDVNDVNFGFSLWTEDNVRVASVASNFVGQTYDLRKGTGKVVCVLPDFPLLAGNYGLKGAIYDARNNWRYHSIGYDGDMPTLRVTTGHFATGDLMLPALGLVHLHSAWTCADD